jgi:hypothetical protein
MGDPTTNAPQGPPTPASIISTDAVDMANEKYSGEEWKDGRWKIGRLDNKRISDCLKTSPVLLRSGCA